MLRSIIVAASLLSLTGLPACQPTETAQSGPVTATGSVDIGGPFELVNQDGQTVTEASFLGRPQLIYFGFSYCPDVCPMALQQMGAAQAKADPKGEYFQPIFISVDPERDTPESLKLYVTANGFPKNLTGLTGTNEQVEAAKDVFRIYAQKVEDPSNADSYTVDHASLIYLMNAEGKFVDVFTHNSTVEDITKRLTAYKKANG